MVQTRSAAKRNAAARVIQMLGRRVRTKRRIKARRFNRTEIGDRVGTASTKEYLTASEQGPLDSRVMQVSSILGLPASSTNDVNERQRNVINLRGWKMYMRFDRVDTGNTASAAQNLHLNIAVLCPRHDKDVANVEDNFFRDGTQNDRALDFNPTTSRHDPLVYCRYPINPDQFTILKHKRYKLGRTITTNSEADANKDSTLTLKWWIPLKRQIRYNGTISTSHQENVFLCMWYDFQGFTSTTVDYGALNFRYFVHLVYREPRT